MNEVAVLRFYFICPRYNDRAFSITNTRVNINKLYNNCLFIIFINTHRQEYLGMLSKYSALESRSKDLIVQQSTAVSGASMALAGLGSRLDKLVEQLISSYNISEQELEVSYLSLFVFFFILCM